MNSSKIGIQCPDISSTSDSYNSPINYNFAIHGRSSYRKSFRCLPLPTNPTIIPCPPIMFNIRNCLSNQIKKVFSMSITLNSFKIF